MPYFELHPSRNGGNLKYNVLIVLMQLVKSIPPSSKFGKISTLTKVVQICGRKVVVLSRFNAKI